MKVYNRKPTAKEEKEYLILNALHKTGITYYKKFNNQPEVEFYFPKSGGAGVLELYFGYKVEDKLSEIKKINNELTI